MDQEDNNIHTNESNETESLPSAPPLSPELRKQLSENEPQGSVTPPLLDVSEPEPIEPDTASDSTPTVPQSEPINTPHPNLIKRFLKGYWHKKLWTFPLTLIIIAAILAGVPWTRYTLAALVLKQNFTVEVMDVDTHKPVSNASVVIDTVSIMTNNQGKATLHVPVGKATLTVSKKYYKTSSNNILVPISTQKTDFAVHLQATGRQVPITITNKLNGQPIENVLIRVADVTARTDHSGQAVVVLPAKEDHLSATFSVAGFNDGAGEVQVTSDVIPQNSFQLTPAGKVYFLSQLSGNIDVVKTNLDGSNRQTVLAGTGNESDTTTELVASRDWKYIALESSRAQTDKPILYILDTTANDKLTIVDNSNADFTLVGWSGDTLVYSIVRHGVPQWQPAGEMLKAYNATNGQTTTLDQTAGTGTNTADYAYTTFSPIYLVNNAAVYTQNWYGSDAAHINGKSVSLFSAKLDGSNKQDVKDFAVPSGSSSYSYSVNLSLYLSQALYVQVPNANNTSNTYYAYANNQLTAQNIPDDTFYKNYPIFLASPGGTQTFWTEQRDGKNVVFIGDTNAQNGKQIASLTDYAAYGWYSDNYLLLSKNDSELYILPTSGGTPLKVTDYHSTSLRFAGYGYGGL